MSTQTIGVGTKPYQRYATTTQGTIPVVRQRWFHLKVGVVSLFLVGGLLSYAAVHLGTLYPASNSASGIGLALCSNVPCFRGLIPGLTPWLAIPDIVPSIPAQSIFRALITIPIGADAEAFIQRS